MMQECALSASQESDQMPVPSASLDVLSASRLTSPPASAVLRVPSWPPTATACSAPPDAPPAPQEQPVSPAAKDTAW